MSAGEFRLQTTVRQKIQLENRITKLADQQRGLPLDWQSKQIEHNRKLSSLAQREIEISSRREYSIKAPISGTLTALRVSEGQMLGNQSPLVSILPSETNLYAELFVPTRAAGFIEKGQQVYLRYEAFPYQHYGSYLGEVQSMSKVLMTPLELPIPVSLSEPVYIVKVSIDKQFVNAKGKTFGLQVGMLLSADIVLEERTLGHWMLEPIYSVTGRL